MCETKALQRLAEIERTCPAGAGELWASWSELGRNEKGGRRRATACLLIFD